MLVASGDLDAICAKLGWTAEKMADFVVVLALNDSAPDTKGEDWMPKLTDEEIINKHGLQNEIVLMGIRQNMAYLTLWSKMVKQKTIRAKYRKMMDSLTNKAMEGNVKAIELALDHGGLATQKTDIKLNIVQMHKNQVEDQANSIIEGEFGDVE